MSLNVFVPVAQAVVPYAPMKDFRSIVTTGPVHPVDNPFAIVTTGPVSP
ncbi:MAG: hypothetical protein ACYDEJ_03055 [Desulfitobacteriaceae bacterium]